MTGTRNDKQYPVWRKALLCFYPYFLAYYPVFALRMHNIGYVELADILRSLLVVTAGTTIIGLVTLLLVRNLERASIIVALTVILFLSYGHIYNEMVSKWGPSIHHRYLVAAGFLILLLIIILVLLMDPVARTLSQFLTTAGIVLLAIVLFESLKYDIDVSRAAAIEPEKETIQTHSQAGNAQPDFYMIILDAHTRSDVLKSRFDYDNSSFIRQLQEMGFYVPACSQSNYASTKLSLTSATYGDYIQDFVPEGEVLPPMKNSAVNGTLQSLGYTTIAFENRAHGQFDLKEDIHLSRNKGAFGAINLTGGINEFEKMLIETSFLRFVVDTELIPGFDEAYLQEWDLWEHYYQTRYILSELEKIPEIPGPKFIYAHLMVPHTPFIFAPDGSFLVNNSPIDGYRSNVEFIDNRLPSILEAIIEKSNPRPIIVVMGDHGPSTRKTITHQMRMSNLAAYLVNDAAKAQMYPTITPINAFRIILNNHYGSTYPHLDDISYYAYKPEDLTDAEIIANECQISP